MVETLLLELLCCVFVRSYVQLVVNNQSKHRVISKSPNPPNIERDFIFPRGSNNFIESFSIGLSMLSISVYLNYATK